MSWMLLPSLLLATGRPRSLNIFGHWVCQRLLLLMLLCPLTRTASLSSLLASSMRSGRGCMPPQGLLLPRAPSYARTTGGLPASGLYQSPTFTCPWVAEACAVCFASSLGPMPCRLRWADGCIWPMLCVCALACIWVMRGIMFSRVPLLRTFAAVIPCSLLTAIELCACSCGIRIRRLWRLACCKFLINFWTELFVASHQPDWLRGHTSIPLPFPITCHYILDSSVGLLQ